MYMSISRLANFFVYLVSSLNFLFSDSDALVCLRCAFLLVSTRIFIIVIFVSFSFFPDLYEIVDKSLGDVQRALDPKFAQTQIANLDSEAVLRKDVFGVSYLPGCSCPNLQQVARHTDTFSRFIHIPVTFRLLLAHSQWVTRHRHMFSPAALIQATSGSTTSR